MSIWGNVFGHAKSTLIGLLTSAAAVAAAGATGAATQFGNNPQVTDWKPYAAAAAAAAIPALVGAFSKDPPATLSEPAQKAATAIEQAGRDYAAIKADEVIANLQKQLGSQP